MPLTVVVSLLLADFLFFFFNDTATTEIYTLSLHDALPISLGAFLWALQGNQSRENALRLFVAVGAANAETRLPGCFSPKRVYELMEQIQIHPGSLTE